MQLKRWAQTEEQEGALLHRVEPNREITFGSRRYSLCSFVSHIGPTTIRGHYSCCIKNPCARGDWWYYNDGTRRVARDSEMETTDKERTYLVMYERVR